MGTMSLKLLVYFHALSREPATFLALLLRTNWNRNFGRVKRDKP